MLNVYKKVTPYKFFETINQVEERLVNPPSGPHSACSAVWSLQDCSYNIMSAARN